MLCQFARVWKLSFVMKPRYEVREYRGAGIEYTAFEGTRAECAQWIDSNCHKEIESEDDSNWVSNDPSHVNGNGFAWKYFIQVSLEK